MTHQQCLQDSFSYLNIAGFSELRLSTSWEEVRGAYDHSHSQRIGSQIGPTLFQFRLHEHPRAIYLQVSGAANHAIH